MTDIPKEVERDGPRASRLLREFALTIGALAGLVCVAAALGALLFGFTPLVFRSGSMAPEIETGALALSRTVPAEDIRVGDIVNVTNAAGDRITHRVVAVNEVAGTAALTLKGDANAEPDLETYIVTEAGRVLVSAPKLGYVVTWLSGPVAVFAGGVLVGVLLMVAWRPRDRKRTESTGADGEAASKMSGGRHSRSTLTVAIAVATVGAVGVASANAPTTVAAWTDSISATSGTFTTALPPVPAPTNVGCENQPGVLGLIGNFVTMSWTPPSGTGFAYRWTITRSIQNGQADRTETVSGTSDDISNGLLLGTRTGTWVFTVQTVSGTRFSAPSDGFTLTMATTTSALNLLPSVRCGSALLAGAGARGAPQTIVPETTTPAPPVTSPLVPESTVAPAPTTTDPSLTEESPAPPPVEVPATTTTVPPTTTTVPPTTTTTTVPPPTTTTPPAPVALSAPQTSPSGASTAQVVDIDGVPTLQIVDATGAVQYSAPATSSEAYGYGVNWSAGDQLWILGPDQLVRLDGSGGSWSRAVIDPTATDLVPADILELLN
ncbi:MULTISPECIES: signal peptidase I [unclassified Rhodococcus (in: high G+C Gram-positive bacteria)]|uniref:signal peptidase I n=1 Tax=unclassified Rhodococcus (in: high G+C Gram-positive bacteria) TaxID=192944 RepID=UPI002952CA5C|nr:signal peptidase I [Rhodococcus sp. IEGM 1343]MDV8055845.1 signal peptidase I [Rhodococcus sp. IEGM 1343]